MVTERAARSSSPGCKNRAALALAVALLSLWASGCRPPLVRAPERPASMPDQQPHLLAGAALTDITPPPGLALFGHGPEGRVATGVLLRLQCRVFVLSQGGEAVALIPCDIAAPSLALQRAIARRVAERDIPLGVDRLVLMATHTHAGPAHYFEAKNYGDNFSARLPGFDPEVVDWLAERIAAAVDRAWTQRIPACAGWISEPVTGLSRNRSFAAFGANTNLPPELRPAVRRDAEQDGDAGAGSPIELAVDPTLSLLRIDDCRDLGHPVPLGTLAVFGVHPTVVPNTNDLYHGDLFGYAVRAAETALESACVGEGALRRCPLVALANGIEGDVSANWGHQAPREARRLGGALAAHIVRLHGEAAPREADGPIVRWTGALSTHFPIRGAYRELHLPGAPVEAPFYQQLCAERDDDLCFAEPPKGSRLCQEGALGTPAAGGAEDGPTRLRALPQMNEGQRAPQPELNPCHREKIRLMPPFEVPHETAPEDGMSWENERDEEIWLGDEEGHAFPTLAPISLLQLGDRLLVAVPAEPTTVVGVRLRRRLEAFLTEHAQGQRPRKAVVVGLVNHWLQYLSTAEEYAQQHYEGASTLYGPDSERFFSNQFVCLANWLYGDARHEADCRMGQPPVGTTHPVLILTTRQQRLEGPPDDLPEETDLDDPHPRRETVDGLDTWSVSWRGVPASFLQTTRSIRVQVVSSASGEVLDDNDGVAMALRFSAGRWTARWFPELRAKHPACNREVQFLIETVKKVRSEPFLVTCDLVAGNGAEEVTP